MWWGLEADVGHQLSLVPSEIYSIDTNVLIEIWSPSDANSMFSKAKMPELWEHVQKLVDEGKIIASREVYDELENHATPELLAWMKAHKHIFVFDKAQVDAATEIINTVYSQYRDGYKPEVMNAADPFVVATAMVHGAVVFSLEHTQQIQDPSQMKSPKIPTVCYHYGIECVNMQQFIEREGFKIGMVATPTAELVVKATAEVVQEPMEAPVVVLAESGTETV